MSSGQQPQPGDNRIKPAEALNFLYFISNCWASAIAPFIRKDFGVEAMGWNGLVAFLLLFCLSAACRSTAMWVYFGLWFLLLIYHRIQTARAVWVRGEVRHSRDPGYPWLAMRVPFVRSMDTATGIIEPEICFLVGCLMCPVSTDVGGFLMVGALAFFVRNGLEREIDRKRLQRMQDAEIEAHYYSEKYRNRGG